MLKRTQKVVTLHWKKTWTHGSTRSINILSSLSITVRSRCCGDPNAIGPIKDFESRYLLWLDGLCWIQYELKAQVSLLTAVILDCIFKVEFLLDCVNCPAGKNTVFSSVAIFSRKSLRKTFLWEYCFGTEPCIGQCTIISQIFWKINPFVPNAPFLYPQKPG